MHKITLASASPQRMKLLQSAGLKFTVRLSRTKEIHKIQTTISALVKKNALEKALYVASRMKSGFVIGADTLVYSSDGKIIGKPKNLKIAKRVINQMTARPHWVYTGVAVVDAKSKRKIIDYEKTKVFMNKLANDEIRRYHGKVSPLDKAGGFDIEGRGGLFISRIEGCYSNVIGLPLAKLRLMFKKLGVSLL